MDKIVIASSDDLSLIESLPVGSLIMDPRSNTTKVKISPNSIEDLGGSITEGYYSYEDPFGTIVELNEDLVKSLFEIVGFTITNEEAGYIITEYQKKK